MGQEASGKQIFIILGVPVVHISPPQLDPELRLRDMDACGVERVMLGNDYPQAMVDRKSCVADVESLDLTPEDKAKILGGNAQRLLGLAHWRTAIRPRQGSSLSGADAFPDRLECARLQAIPRIVWGGFLGEFFTPFAPAFRAPRGFSRWSDGMTVEIRDERFRQVVGEDAPIERIATGFIFTEGPIWHPAEMHLTFSDIIDNKVHRWIPGAKGGEGTLSVYRQPSNMANGNTYDREGRMLSCEHSTSRVVREEGKDLAVVASHYQGKELNSPNDIVVKSDGRIYFTDPPAGRSERYGRFRPQELDFQGFFQVDSDGGNLTLLGDDFIVPNGLCFSVREDRLFVNDTRRKHIRVFDVQADGSVSGGAVWAEPVGEGEGAPDGMKVDSGDNLYCTGPGGIHVFGPDAVSLGVIRVPERTANFTWGGDDMRDFFITASTSVYHTRVKVPGMRLF